MDVGTFRAWLSGMDDLTAEQREEVQEILDGREPGEEVRRSRIASRPSSAVRIAVPEAGSSGGAPTACGGTAAKPAARASML